MSLGPGERTSKTYTAAQGRKFGLTVGVAFLLFGGLAWWREHFTLAFALGGLGAALVVGAVAFPRALRGVDASWMKLALLISRVTTPLFMGIIYFVVITPIGLVRRLLGGDPLAHEGAVTAPASNWYDRSASSRSRLDRLF